METPPEQIASIWRRAVTKCRASPSMMSVGKLRNFVLLTLAILPPVDAKAQTRLAFEVGGGMGLVRADQQNVQAEITLLAVAFSGSVGVRLNSRVAIEATVATVVHALDGYYSSTLFGAAVRYQIRDALWVRGALGLGLLRAPTQAEPTRTLAYHDNDVGPALELRIGYSFATRFAVSLGYTSGWYEVDNSRAPFFVDPSTSGPFTVRSVVTMLTYVR